MIVRLPRRHILRRISISTPTTQPFLRHTYATAALATVSALSPDQIHFPPSAIQRYPPTKPPSYKPPELRKSQLLRSYASLLRSTPLMLIFQHNNLRAAEWAGIRRELAIALRKAAAADAAKLQTDGATSALQAEDITQTIRLQVIQSGIFAAALRVAEFYTPPSTEANQDSTTPIHATEQDTSELTHDLSQAAYLATRLSSDNPNLKRNTPLHALLSGPLAIVSFPSLHPTHLSTVLRILSPTAGASSAFPAPRRRDNPGLYETPVQNGLQKLMLLGARAEGRVLDQDGVRWVGGLEDLETLRARVVALLTGVGMGVTGVLEGAGRSLWIGLEGRRLDMEEKEKGASSDAPANAAAGDAQA